MSYTFTLREFSNHFDIFLVVWKSFDVLFEWNHIIMMPFFLRHTFTERMWDYDYTPGFRSVHAVKEGRGEWWVKKTSYLLIMWTHVMKWKKKFCGNYESGSIHTVLQRQALCPIKYHFIHTSFVHPRSLAVPFRIVFNCFSWKTLLFAS